MYGRVGILLVKVYKWVAKSVLWVFEKALKRLTDEFLWLYKVEKRSIFQKKWANKGRLSVSFNMCIQCFSSFFVLRCLLIAKSGKGSQLKNFENHR